MMKDALRVANLLVGLIALVMVVYAMANGRYLMALEWFAILGLIALVLGYAMHRDTLAEREREAEQEAAWAEAEAARMAAMAERDRRGNEIVKQRIARSWELARQRDAAARHE